MSVSFDAVFVGSASHSQPNSAAMARDSLQALLSLNRALLSGALGDFADKLLTLARNTVFVGT